LHDQIPKHSASHQAGQQVVDEGSIVCVVIVNDDGVDERGHDQGGHRGEDHCRYFCRTVCHGIGKQGFISIRKFHNKKKILESHF